MLSSEVSWFADSFKALEKSLHDRIDDIETTTHRKLDALVLAAHHILITRGQTDMDHAAILADLKKFEADLDTTIDVAVTEFATFGATHTATKDSLDDIGAIVSGLPSKLDKLKALKAPTDEAVPPASGPTLATTVIVSGSVTAPEVIIPVTADTLVPAGSAVSGPGIAPGSTVLTSTPTSITLDQPTTADHVGDGSETLTVTTPPTG